VENIIKSLHFKNFSIEFNIDVNKTIIATNQYCPKDIKDYLFIVATGWLKVNDQITLLASEWHIYNLIIFLEHLKEMIANPINLDNILDIELGGLNKWSRIYLNIFDEDCNRLTDDTIYDKIESAFLIDDGHNYLSIYSQCDLLLIEATTEDKAGNIVECYSNFNKEETVVELEIIKADIKLELSKKWYDIDQDLILEWSVPENHCTICSTAR